LRSMMLGVLLSMSLTIVVSLFPPDSMDHSSIF
jgi:hypothetical protein